ncbi:MAG: Blue-light-activated protein [Gemmatimonadetes bacterium]|nr:Blue-light-activated protein [Gemmatimonadota bacterium]
MAMPELRTATEQRRGEDAAAQGDLLRAVLETTIDPVFVKDRDGRYLFYNQAAADSIGRTAAEVLGRTDAEIFDEATAQSHAGSDARVLATGVPDTAEEWVTVDGRARCYLVTKTPFHDPGGGIAAVIGISRDITGRKRVEEDLRDSERRLSNAERLAHVGSWENDLAADRIFWSDETYRILGLVPGNTLTVAEFREHIHPEDREIQAHATQRAFDGEARYEARYRVVRPSGEVRIVHSIGEVVRDEHGRPLRAFGAAQDITERVALEEQFLQAQKMEAVGRLAGGVAHDFNNLLTVIIGNTNLLLLDLAPSDPRHCELAEVLQAAASAERLTRQLLAFSRREVVQPRRVVLEDALTAAEALLRRLIGDDVLLVILPGSPPSTVQIDPGQLEQVVLNLAVNARDAMPTGGELAIETHAAEVHPEQAAAHGLAGGGRFAVLSVRDGGMGMDEGTRARIFEPYFTTKEVGKGTGLGLSTVYGIVKRNGGFVTVESEPGRGTTIAVHLPLAGTAAEPAPETSAPAEPPRGSETVLLVEDNPHVRKTVCRLLKRTGYRVIEAAGAEAAIAAAACAGEPIHLLLTDVVMPGMSGRELAEVLTASRPGLRVLYTSGCTDAAIMRHGVLEPGISFLAKPFSPDALARKVREVLDRPSEA